MTVISEQRRALIIVDVQEDFVEGGSLAVAGGRELADNIASRFLTDSYFYDLIITTQDWHIDPGSHFSDEPDFVNSWPVHCKAETEGARVLPVIESQFESLLVKRERILKGQYEDAYSGFMGKNLNGESIEDLLKANEVSFVDVVGIAGNYCVKSTAIDSANAGFTTRVLKDYTAWIPNGTEDSALKELEDANVEVLG